MSEMFDLYQTRYKYYWRHLHFYTGSMSENETCFFGVQIAAFITGQERDGFLALVIPKIMTEFAAATANNIRNL